MKILKIIGIIVISFILFWILLSITKSTFMIFSSSTIIENQVVDLGKSSRINFSKGVIKKGIFRKEKIDGPIFSLDGDRIMITKPSSLIIVGDKEIAPIRFNEGLFIINDENGYQIFPPNKGKNSIIELPKTETEEFKKAVIQINSQEYFTMYGTVIQVDGKEFDVPPLSYIKITNEEIYIGYVEEEQLIYEKHPYIENYNINLKIDESNRIPDASDGRSVIPID